MFLTLLVVEILISLVIAWLIVRIFSQPIEKILHRISPDETSRAWLTYVKFAIYVAGLSGGVKITERDVADFEFRMFPSSRWAFEIYTTIIGALRSIFWFFAYLFIVLAIAFVIVRVVELIKSKPVDTQDRA